MNWNTVNWKTTAYAISYFFCQIVGGIYEPVRTLCDILEAVIVPAGFLSAADATRVQNVVRAVDTILYKQQIDPETLQPIVK